MPLTGRTRSEIVSDLLTDWSARMTALGLTLDTSEGSWARDEAEALAPDLLALEANSEALARELVPRTASTEMLERMATLQGQPRAGGVKGRWTVTVTGEATGTVDATGRTLTRNGLVYVPLQDNFGLTAGSYNLPVEASDAGEEYALTAGDTLTWDAAPTGLVPTATVVSEETEATDAEADAELALRVEAYRRGRPASGSPPHLIELAEAHEDCAQAYVYPTLGPNSLSPGTYADSRLDTPGAFCVLVMGPAQGQGASETRARTADHLAAIRAYFHGTQDAEGNATPNGSRLYCCTMDPDDVTVIGPNVAIVAVTLDILPDAENEPPWTGTMATAAGCDATHLVVAGDHASKSGEAALVYVGTATRGGWQKVTLPSNGVFGGVNTTWTFLSGELLAAPSGTVYPPLGHWETLRDAFFTWFDGLGPGDVPSVASVPPPASIARRRRYPAESVQGPANVYRSALVGVAMRAGGSENITVTVPIADAVADPFELHVLGDLLLRRA